MVLFSSQLKYFSYLPIFLRCIYVNLEWAAGLYIPLLICLRPLHIPAVFLGLPMMLNNYYIRNLVSFTKYYSSECYKSIWRGCKPSQKGVYTHSCPLEWVLCEGRTVAAIFFQVVYIFHNMIIVLEKTLILFLFPMACIGFCRWS